MVTEGEMREVCFFALQHFKRSIPVQIMYNDGTAIGKWGGGGGGGGGGKRG